MSLEQQLTQKIRKTSWNYVQILQNSCITFVPIKDFLSLCSFLLKKKGATALGAGVVMCPKPANTSEQEWDKAMRAALRFGGAWVAAPLASIPKVQFWGLHPDLPQFFSLTYGYINIYSPCRLEQVPVSPTWGCAALLRGMNPINIIPKKLQLGSTELVCVFFQAEASRSKSEKTIWSSSCKQVLKENICYI